MASSVTSNTAVADDSKSQNVSERRVENIPSATAICAKVSKVRNIIILGKTGAGKASVANAILGEDKFTIGETVESFTRRRRDLEIVTHKPNGKDYEYRVKIIDTAEVYNRETSQSVFTADLKQVFDNPHFRDGISLVLFVYKHGRLTEQEITAFDSAISRLGKNLSRVSALIVTCCEQKGEKARARIVKDIEESALTSKLAKFAEKGIIPVGLPRLADIDEDIRPLIEDNVRKDKCTLKKLAESASEMQCINLHTQTFISQMEKRLDQIGDEIGKQYDQNCNVC